MKLFRRKRKMDLAKYAERWDAIQKLCSSRKTWPQAVVKADELLDEALKGKGYKGKTTGERLVAAQHELSSNETVWAGHKLCKTLNVEDVDVRKLKKKDVVQALSGFRQALRDLGALNSGK